MSFRKQQSPDQAVAEETAKKLTLEKRLKDEMTRIFNQIGRQAADEYRAKNQLLNPAAFQDEIEVILRQHGRRVAAKFQRTLRNDVPDDAAQISPELVEALKNPEMQAEIATNIAAALALQARKSAELITNTNRQALETDLGMATAEAVGATPTGQAITGAVIAAGLKRTWDRQTDGRVQTISITETETDAETAKAIEAAAIEQQKIPGLEIVKMWITVGDSRVRGGDGGRFNHIAADRQIRRLDEPFLVSGERLMFPKDTSLGASSGNVINCRCIANRFAQRVEPRN